MWLNAELCIEEKGKNAEKYEFCREEIVHGLFIFYIFIFFFPIVWLWPSHHVLIQAIDSATMPRTKCVYIKCGDNINYTAAEKSTSNHCISHKINSDLVRIWKAFLGYTFLVCIHNENRTCGFPFVCSASDFHIMNVKTCIKCMNDTQAGILEYCI